jgi:hypothetical protein
MNISFELQKLTIFFFRQANTKHNVFAFVLKKVLVLPLAILPTLRIFQLNSHLSLPAHCWCTILITWIPGLFGFTSAPLSSDKFKILDPILCTKKKSEDSASQVSTLVCSSFSIRSVPFFASQVSTLVGSSFSIRSVPSWLWFFLLRKSFIKKIQSFYVKYCKFYFTCPPLAN